MNDGFNSKQQNSSCAGTFGLVQTAVHGPLPALGPGAASRKDVVIWDPPRYRALLVRTCGWGIWLCLGTLFLALLAGLDSIFGAFKAYIAGTFEPRVFLSGLVTNMALAGGLTYVGDKLGVDLSIAAQARYIVAFMETLGVHQAAVAGHDIGGGVAQLMAVDEPQRVARLILIDSIVDNNWPVGDIARLKEPAWDQIMVNIDLRKGLRQGLDAGMVTPGRLTDELVDEWTRPFQDLGGRRAYLRAARALNNRDLTSRSKHIDEIETPTLILWGANDKFLESRWAEVLHQKFRESTLEIIDPGGHFLPLDRPDAVAEAKVPVVVHPTMQRAATLETFNTSLCNAMVLADKKVPLAIGTGFEGYVPKTRVVRHEAAMAMVNGLGRERALAAITLDAAKILKIDDRYGSIEAGKAADLVLYDADPFEWRRQHVARGREVRRMTRTAPRTAVATPSAAERRMAVWLVATTGIPRFRARLDAAALKGNG